METVMFPRIYKKVVSFVHGWSHFYLHLILFKGCDAEMCKLFHNNSAMSLEWIDCPRPGDPLTYSTCCRLEDSDLSTHPPQNNNYNTSELNYNHTCCAIVADNNGYNLSLARRVGIAFSIIVSVIVVTFIILTLLYKYTKCCRKSPFAAYTPRFKVKFNAKKQNVGPSEKRTLLKTANYTVDKSWDQVIIKFHHQGFFDHFNLLLTSRYKELSWDAKEPKIGTVKNSEGKSVGLRVIEHSKFIIVTDVGNANWVMNDFQNICKNIQISDNPADKIRNNPLPRSHPLLPRLPTIDEQHYKADDYNVRITQTEIDIKFYTQIKFDHFKHAVLLKYPTVPWSKYLQRDCAQVKLEGGRRVTLHLWEEIRSIWLSGDGRMDWYHNEFEELLQQSNDASFIESYFVRPWSGRSKRSMSLATQASLASDRSPKSYKDITTVYTVKTLDTGGYELEFPNNEFLTILKVLLKVKYPKLAWKEYSCRHIAKIELEKNKSVSVHISTDSAGQRKIWIYDESKQDWINDAFRELYFLAYRHLYERDKEYVPIEDENNLAKVESNQ